MRILNTSIWYILIAITLVLVAGFFVYKTINPSMPEWVTANVEKGTVSEVVSVSGFVEAKRTAELTFPSSGVVTDVFVEEGAQVEQGDLLATLAATQLVAERAEAVSQLTASQATYEKTIAGPRSETIAVAEATIKNAEENLIRTTAEENKKVDNARVALLSTGLTVTAIDFDETSTAPTVSGTYLCQDEGTYELKIYNSNAQSGYSYNYSGLESGTGSVTFDQPSPLGNCGLFLLFTEGNLYANSQWQIELPNTRSSSYSSLNNAFELAKTVAKNSIASAENALTIAKSEANLSTAPARSEDITGAQASVLQAQARISAIDARIADRSIIAPFSGTITDISITAGESAPNTPVITVLAENAFTLKARVPEIDITKIAVGQIVKSIFDANSDETISGTVIYISPIATQIDGVAYFETTIKLDEIPSWLRAGLNADIDIIAKSKEQVLRLPKRFVFTQPDGKSAVLIPQGNKTATTTVEVIFVGNDSFLEVSGLSEGTTVVAP